MEIKTKFNLNEKIYTIQLFGQRVFTPCKICNGSGVVKVEEIKEKIECPRCYGNGGSSEWTPEKWNIAENSKIGKIDIEIYHGIHKKENKDRFAYMIESTGIGSGTIWYESDCFKTKEEAELECKKRNRKKKNIVK